MIENSKNEIELLNIDVIEKFGSHLKYILLECNNPNCRRTWGVNINRNTLRKEQLLCQQCATKKIAEEK